MKQMSRRMTLFLAAVLFLSLLPANVSAVPKQLPVPISQSEKSGYEVYWPITAKAFVEAFNATAADQGKKGQRIESYKKKERFSASWAEGKVYMFVNVLANGYIGNLDFHYRSEEEASQAVGRDVLKTLTATLCRNDKKKGNALYKTLIAQVERETRSFSQAGYQVESHEVAAESCRFYFDVNPVEVSIHIAPQENASTKEGAPIPTAAPVTGTPRPTQPPFGYLKMGSIVYHARKSCSEFDVEDGEMIQQAYLHQLEKSKLYVPCPACAKGE